MYTLPSGMQKVGTIGTVGPGKQQNSRGRKKKWEKMKKSLEFLPETWVRGGGNGYTVHIGLRGNWSEGKVKN